MTIGKNIKRLRVNKGITQEQLAGQLHITDKAVSKWENETAFPDISLLPTIAAYALYQKYGVIVNYCHDRKVLDSRGRLLCGYTLQDGDRIVVVDDFILSGKTLMDRMDAIMKSADVQIEAVVVIADRMMRSGISESSGSKMIEERYHTKVYSITTEEDISKAIERQII